MERPAHTKTSDAALVEAMLHVSGLLAAGRYRDAHAQLERIVEKHPNFVEAHRLLGGCKLALGNAAGAEQSLRQALSLDPAWPPTLATLGEMLLMQGRIAEAEPLLRKAASGTTPSPHAALLLARYYNDNRRSADALAVCAPLCESGRADAELVAQHVAALAALGRHEEAVAIYQRLVAAAPGNAAAAHALAIALDAAGRPAQAEHAAWHAISNGHRSAAVYLTHARSLVALGDFERAENALRESLRIDSRGLDAHNMLARLVWMRSGDRAQATAALDDALRRFAGDDALLAAKAAILQGAGDARMAYACLADKTTKPHAAPALLIRAGLAALEFDPSTARELATRALRATPGNNAALSLLAAAELGTGDARSALAYAETLLAAAPDDQYLIALQTIAWRLLGDARYAQLCDYANLAIPFRLQTPEGWADLTAFFDDLKRSLERLHNPHGHPLLFQSLRHGTETTDDLARSTDPAIQALFRSFDAPIRDYLARIGRGDDPLRRRNQGTYRFNGGWSVRLRSSGFHNSHVHPRGWISSACYIELPDVDADPVSHAGCLTFGQPSLLTTPPLRSEHVIRPEVGMLVLFPSYFWHGTVPFVSAQTRLTVAFDVVPSR